MGNGNGDEKFDFSGVPEAEEQEEQFDFSGVPEAEDNGEKKNQEDTLLTGSPESESETPSTSNLSFSERIVQSLTQVIEQKGEKAIRDSKIPAVLEKNKKANFVQRILDPNRQVIIGDDKKEITHKMAWGQSDDGFFVIPTVVEKDGKLQELSTDDAVEHAKTTKEVLFFDNEQEAKEFADGAWKQFAPQNIPEPESRQRILQGIGEPTLSPGDDISKPIDKDVAPEFTGERLRDDIMNVTKDAIDRGLASGEIADLLPAGHEPTMEEIERIIELRKITNENEPSESFQQFGQAKGLKAKVWEFVKDPLLITSELMAESLAAMVRHGISRVPLATAEGALLGAGVGAPAGGVGVIPGAIAGGGYGLIAGFGLTSLNLEYSAKILEEMEAQGVDMTDSESMMAFFQDDEKIADARWKAWKRGVPIAVVDMVSAGIAGKVVGLAKPGMSLAKRTALEAGEIAIQGTAGAFGEGLAQKVSGEDLDFGEMFAEFIGDIGGSAPEMVVSRIKIEAKKGQLQKETVIDGVTQTPKSDLEFQVNVAEQTGEISKSEADAIRKEIREVEKTVETVPEGIEGEDLANTVKLIEERKAIEAEIENLEENKKATDPAYHGPLDQLISDAKARIEKVNTDIQEIAGLNKPEDAATEEIATEETTVTPETKPVRDIPNPGDEFHISDSDILYRINDDTGLVQEFVDGVWQNSDEPYSILDKANKTGFIRTKKTDITPQAEKEIATEETTEDVTPQPSEETATETEIVEPTKLEEDAKGKEHEEHGESEAQAQADEKTVKDGQEVLTPPVQEEEKATPPESVPIEDGTRAKEEKPFRSGKFEVVTDETGKKSVINRKNKKPASKSVSDRVLNEYKKSKTDEIALQGEPVSLEGIPEDRASEHIADNSDSPAQVAQAWVAEPDTIDTDASTQSKMDKVHEALKGSTFTEGAVSHIVDFSKEEGKNFRLRRVRKPGTNFKAINDISELAETLGVDQQLIEDYIVEHLVGRTEYQQGKGKNPAKLALAEKFQQLTGLPIDEEFAETLGKRSPKLREEKALTEKLDILTGQTPPKPIEDFGSKEKKKNLLNRIMNDPSVPQVMKDAIKKLGLTYNTMPNKYINEVAQEEVAATIQTLGMEEALLSIEQEASEKIDQDNPMNEVVKSRKLSIASAIARGNGMVEIHKKLSDRLDKRNRLAGQMGQINILDRVGRDVSPDEMADEVMRRIEAEQKAYYDENGVGDKTYTESLKEVKEELAATKEKLKKARETARQTFRDTSKYKPTRKPPKQRRTEAIDTIKKILSGQSDLFDKDFGNQGFASGLGNENFVKLTNAAADIVISFVEEGVVFAGDLINKVADQLKRLGVPEKSARDIATQAVKQVSESGPYKMKDAPDPSTLEAHPVKGKGKQERIEALDVEQSKVEMAEPVEQGVQGELEDMTDEQMQNRIDEVVTEHYETNDMVPLEDKLAGLGLSKPRARKIAKAVRKSMRDKAKAARVLERVLGAEVRKLKGYSELLNDLTDAMASGVLSQADVNNVFAKFFGLSYINPAAINQVTMLINQIHNAPSNIIKSRRIKQLKTVTAAMKGQRFFPKIGGLLMEVFYVGILSGPTTAARALVGALITHGMEKVKDVIRSPIATAIGFKYAIGSAGYLTGVKQYLEILKSGHSDLDYMDLTPDGERQLDVIVNKAYAEYLREVGRVRSVKGAAKVIPKAAMNGFIKTVMFLPVMMYRNLIAMDVILKHGILEWNSYIAKYNELLTPADYKDFGAFLTSVNEEMGNQKIENHKRQAEVEAAQLRSQGQAVPGGFKSARVKELLMQARGADFSAKMNQDALQTLLMNQPVGTLGNISNALSNKLNIREEDNPFAVMIKMAMRTVFPFLRVPTNFVNMGLDYTPVGAIRGVKSAFGVGRGTFKVSDTKPTVTETMDHFIRSGIGMTLGFILYSMLFDEDDEEKRMFRITGIGLKNWSENKTVDASYSPLKIQFRNDPEKDWNDKDNVSSWKYVDNPIGFMIAPFGAFHDKVILGEDDDAARAKTIGNMAWGAFQFGYQQSYNQGINDIRNLIMAAGNPDDPGGFTRTFGKSFDKRLKGFTVPNLYKQMSQQADALLQEPDKEANTLKEQLMKDVPFIESYLENDATDMIGLPQVREFSPALFPDFVIDQIKEMKGLQEKVYPEWQLIHKFSEVTFKEWYPQRTVKVGGKSHEVDKGEQVLQKRRYKKEILALIRENLEDMQEIETPERLQKKLNKLRTRAVSRATQPTKDAISGFDDDDF